MTLNKVGGCHAYWTSSPRPKKSFGWVFYAALHIFFNPPEWFLKILVFCPPLYIVQFTGKKIFNIFHRQILTPLPPLALGGGVVSDTIKQYSFMVGGADGGGTQTFINEDGLAHLDMLWGQGQGQRPDVAKRDWLVPSSKEYFVTIETTTRLTPLRRATCASV